AQMIFACFIYACPIDTNGELTGAPVFVFFPIKPSFVIASSHCTHLATSVRTMRLLEQSVRL
ncbi:MAG: hypothetical protein IIZ46_06440, partial [Clostridia bacterium]|nr:hypothetical protein [Clostridia bacterium]